MDEPVYIGLLGLGVVGSGVAKVLERKRDDIRAAAGQAIDIQKILVRDLSRPRSVQVAGRLTTNVAEIIDDPRIAVIVELIGGEEPAYEYLRRGIAAGKHVVTANKEVIAKYGPELLALARERHVDVYFEASVGGGIPLISPFKQVLVANQISRVRAIINGTTNFILSKMAGEGTAFPTALSQAQALGYAEADPRNDVDGVDAAYKLAILASLAFHSEVRPHDVFHEGISALHPHDFRYARELGYAIKLLAIARRSDGAIEARVHPVLIPGHVLLAQVDGVFNAVEAEGDLTGRVMFYGRGAGAEPTAGAVVADIIDVVRNLRAGVANRIRVRYDEALPVKPMRDVVTRYYLRMQVDDRPGVLAQIAYLLGDHQISIASVMQKESDETGQTAEIVIMTHSAREASVQTALTKMKTLAVVKELSSFIRVES